MLEKRNYKQKRGTMNQVKFNIWQSKRELTQVRETAHMIQEEFLKVGKTETNLSVYHRLLLGIHSLSQDLDEAEKELEKL